MPSVRSQAILPEPPEHLKRLSAKLTELIRDRIGEQGGIAFSTFMEMALYQPGLGYYSAGLEKFGARGDFVTAPQLGPVFAECLAAQVAEVGDRLGAWDLVEIGAGSGRLAADLLNALPADRRPDRYRILERSGDLRDRQERTLAQATPDCAGLVEWLDAPPTDNWQGVVLANEVVDAQPVERFRVHGNKLEHLLVGCGQGGFHWRTGALPESLDWRIRTALGDRLAALGDGYTSEICATLPEWLDSITASLRRGVALIIDYGYPRREYYLPERRDGTLICHYRHRAHDDPFLWPGLQDISAFVDFTALAEAGAACGLDLAGYTNQAMFLIGCGLQDQLQALETLEPPRRLDRTREIRELTLPQAMGEKFQCLALARDYDSPLRGFSESDLSYRL